MIRTVNEEVAPGIPLDRSAPGLWVIIHKEKRFISRICNSEAVCEAALADREEAPENYEVQVWENTFVYPDPEDEGADWVRIEHEDREVLVG